MQEKGQTDEANKGEWPPSLFSEIKQALRQYTVILAVICSSFTIYKMYTEWQKVGSRLFEPLFDLYNSFVGDPLNNLLNDVFGVLKIEFSSFATDLIFLNFVISIIFMRSRFIGMDFLYLKYGVLFSFASIVWIALLMLSPAILVLGIMALPFSRFVREKFLWLYLNRCKIIEELRDERFSLTYQFALFFWLPLMPFLYSFCYALYLLVKYFFLWPVLAFKAAQKPHMIEMFNEPGFYWPIQHNIEGFRHWGEWEEYLRGNGLQGVYRGNYLRQTAVHIVAVAFLFATWMVTDFYVQFFDF